jgi:hypothetical protein
MKRPERDNLIWYSPEETIPRGACRVPDDIPTYAVELDDVTAFLAALPDDFKPPTQKNPQGGLPKNVWVGGRIEDVWPEILDVRSRIRFLIVDQHSDLIVLEDALSAWRCSNCGRRGTAPRPKTCPHAAHLCGDAKLLPQIQWVIDLGDDVNRDVKELADETGVAYWPSDFPDVR